MLDDYFDGEGFIDIPRVVSDGKEFELFPGLIRNVQEIRARDFPLFDQTGRIYLDSAATSQEPDSVKDRMHEYRKTHLRGSNHSKNSEEARSAQEMNEQARRTVSDFFGAFGYHTIFTGGTTDSSNELALRFPFEKDDWLLLTEAEHNSQVCTPRKIAESKGANVEYLPTTHDGRLDMQYLKKVAGGIRNAAKKRKVLFNLVHVSNVTGVVNPVREVREILGDDVMIYLDMAQSAGHIPINIHLLGADFAGISSHKMYGPTGMGALFVRTDKEKLLMDNISGGSAVRFVTKRSTIPEAAPARFEPGTQDLEGSIEWMYAIDYMNQLGMKSVEAHDTELGRYFAGELKKIRNVTVYGPSDFRDRTGVVSFNLRNPFFKTHEHVAQELDRRNISVRDGCFCTHTYTAKLMGVPEGLFEARGQVMRIGLSENLLSLPGAVRASFAFYNTLNEAYRTVQAVREIAGKR